MTIVADNIKACLEEMLGTIHFDADNDIVRFGFVDERGESTDIGLRVSDDPVQYPDRKRQLLEMTASFNDTKELRVLVKKSRSEVLEFLSHANGTLNWTRMVCHGSEEGFCFFLYCCVDAACLDVDDISSNGGESDFILTIQRMLSEWEAFVPVVRAVAAGTITNYSLIPHIIMTPVGYS